MGIKAAIARGTHGSRKVGYYWGGSSSSCHPYHLTQYNKHTWLQGWEPLPFLLPLTLGFLSAPPSFTSQSRLWFPSPLRNCYWQQRMKEEIFLWTCDSQVSSAPLHKPVYTDCKCMVTDKLSKDFCWRYANFRETWFKYMKTTQGSLESTQWLGTPWKRPRNFPRTAESSFFAPVGASPQVWSGILHASFLKRQSMYISKFGHVPTCVKEPHVYFPETVRLGAVVKGWARESNGLQTLCKQSMFLPKLCQHHVHVLCASL